MREAAAVEEEQEREQELVVQMAVLELEGREGFRLPTFSIPLTRQQVEVFRHHNLTTDQDS